MQVIMLKFICLATLICWCSEAKQLSEEERARIVEVHRKLREEVEPPASNMMLMEYSVDLEKMAEKWFLNCTYPEYEDAEVVLQYGYDPEDASFEPASKFDNDKEAYRYETNSCTGLCGNYRRIIWAKLRQVGCYRSRCEHSDIWPTPRHVMACFYKPVGLNVLERPYERGSSCSGCPKGLGCFRKQCTEMTTPGAELYASEPPEDVVATDSLETIEPPIQIQIRTSTTKMPLIQTQKMSSPTKKPLIDSQLTTSTTKKASTEKHHATIPAEVLLELIQKQSGEASEPHSQATPIETDQSTIQSQTTTSISKRLSAVDALFSVFIAIIFLS